MNSDERLPAELREHFEIERELAGRLRSAGSPEERRSLYAQVYEERSRRIAHHPLVRRAEDPGALAAAAAPQVELLRPLLNPMTRFCEIGAGDGAVARGVAPLVDTSLALDVTDALATPDDESCGYAFRVFDGFELPVPDASLDVVYSNDVAEHLHPDDLLDQTRAICQALKRGGAYVCVTPNRLSGPHDISRHFATVPQGFHLREYTTTELARLLREAGFTKVEALLTIRGRRLTPPFPASWLRPVEAVLDSLPRAVGRRLAIGLAAVKVVAVR